MRVLVAEDDPGLREVLIQGLEEAGYFVDAVEAGDDAIEQLHFYEYDVAIVDWRMPHASGLDVVSWARRHSHPAAMLMLTARDTLPDRIEGLDAGADDYLVKPFDFGELLARVRALQRRPHRHRARCRVSPGSGMNRRLQRVHIASLRVALMASAILAVVYTVVAAIVVMVVTGSLTSQVDNRLGAVLAAVQNNERITPFTGVTDPSAGAPYTAQLIAWIVRSDGTCQGYAVAPDGHLLPLTNAVLPVSARSVSKVTTVTLSGDDVRINGVGVGGGRVVVGQTLDAVSQT